MLLFCSFSHFIYLNFFFLELQISYGVHKRNQALRSQAFSCVSGFSKLGGLFQLTPFREKLTKKCLRISAAAASSPSGGRRVKRRSAASSKRAYRESQAQGLPVPVKQIASFVLPAGAFLVCTFGIFFFLSEIFMFFFHLPLIYTWEFTI